MSYSPQLAYFMERMSGGFSTNVFKLEPQGSNTAQAGKTIRVNLPSNVLLNTRSVKMMFNVSLGGTACRARIPSKTSSFVERCSLYMGGIQVQSGSNAYGLLCHAKDALMGNRSNSVLEHPEIVRKVSYVDGNDKAPATNPNANETYPEGTTEHAIMFWEGFLGSVEPRIVDLSLLPECVLEIQLADNNILSSSLGTDFPLTANSGFNLNGAGGATYTLNNIHFMCEAVGLNDGNYDALVENSIQQKGYLELPFKQYYHFSNAQHTGSTPFSCSSQSIDRIWLAWRATGAGSGQKAPKHVQGYKVAGGFTSSASISDTTAGGAVDQDVGKPAYDIGGSLDTNKEKYNPEWANFQLPSVGATGKVDYRVELNGAQFPQWNAQDEDWYCISQNSLLGNHNPHEMSLDQYKRNYGVQCVRLNLPNSEYSRLVSGLNTLAVNLQARVNTNGVDDANLTIFVETSPCLRVGAGKMIEVLN